MKERFWHKILEYKYFIALVVFVAVMGFVGDSSLVDRISQKETIATLKHEIQEQQAQFIKEKEDLANIQKDPAIVKQVAHEKYYMKAADEDVFVIEDE